MTDEMIGIRLEGGPPQLAGWANAYEASRLGGWPPPDEIAVLTIGGVVAVALPENVPDDFVKDVVTYRKIYQSSIEDIPPPGVHFFRGATYEYVKNDG